MNTSRGSVVDTGRLQGADLLGEVVGGVGAPYPLQSVVLGAGNSCLLAVHLEPLVFAESCVALSFGSANEVKRAF